MGDGEHGALEFLQILLQPLGGPQIQVVGGLVQQEDVGVLQNEAGQVHPGLLSAGEFVEELLPHGLGNGQAVADFVGLGLGVVASGGLKGGGELVIPAHHRGVGVSLGHLYGQLGHLPLHAVQRLEGGGQYVLHGVARRVNRDLGDEAQPLSRGQHHISLVVVHDPSEDAEQGGLAAAVGPQQTNPLPRVHLEGQAIQYFISNLKFFDQIGYGNIDHNVLLRGLFSLQHQQRVSS